MLFNSVVQGGESLKHFQPGDTMQVGFAESGINPDLSIKCDRLVPGQQIEFVGPEWE